MAASVSTQDNMQGMICEMEPTINFVDSQSPSGMYSQHYPPYSSTLSTVRSVVREASDSQSSANMALIRTGPKSGAWKLTRAMRGNTLRMKACQGTQRQPTL